ncbi:Asp-tRNA(Asn)/Glu-tRNA(Gln) amidotransferase subunit GatC [Paraburkholderia tropica]|uniref:Asp-tRNA(Asn)/Glu-tRNA(Gln) amidotransferase subunit GatC n=1 Tax=Paraburkholderia tropica TaxID=92647 RepID=UPI002AB0A104|nr:Asp-tRNA(Asn)/Glu-tRNA(Gln) amidotransferase subunit GatC [Paraburkholderia tropica]
MNLDMKDMRHIAELAQLDLPDTEAGRALLQINEFFGLVQQIQAVDTTGVSPMTHPVELIGELELRLREDVVTEVVDRSALQEAAPEVRDGLYMVPQVLEQESRG